MTVLVSGYALGLTLYLVLRLLFGDRFWWLAVLNSFAPYAFFPLFAVLPLALLIREWRLLALVTGLTLIGVLWYGPYFLPKTHPVATDPTIQLVTFNVWGGNPHLDRIADWLYQQDADVILLQEVPVSFRRNTLPRFRDLYPYQFAPPTDMDWWNSVTLSRYPILTHDVLEALPDNPLPAIHRLTLDINGKTIAVYNIHLEIPLGKTARLPAPYALPYLGLALRYDDTVRNGQIERLLTYLATETEPYIVAGDFNMSDQTVTYQTLSSRLGDSFREAGIGFGTSWPLSVSGDLPEFMPPLFRIDYVWHNRDFVAIAAQQGPRLGSDHLPLLVTVEILSSDH